jgi:hypothetical protein
MWYWAPDELESYYFSSSSPPAMTTTLCRNCWNNFLWRKPNVALGKRFLKREYSNLGSKIFFYFKASYNLKTSNFSWLARPDCYYIEMTVPSYLASLSHGPSCIHMTREEGSDLWLQWQISLFYPAFQHQTHHCQRTAQDPLKGTIPNGELTFTPFSSLFIMVAKPETWIAIS